MTQASVKLIAFDLDGTLSQHRSTPPPESFALLDELSKDYRLLMVGAGACERIHRQMNHYPIDIIGNYGMQTALFNKRAGCLELIESSSVPADRDGALRYAAELRRIYGWEEYTGETIEFHPSGMLTFPLLGTRAAIEDKLAADPTRKIRQAALDEVRKRFTGYTVFVGGSSSFDIVPLPYRKSFALEMFAKKSGISLDEMLYAGDDYGPGGNDEDVYTSGIRFVRVDDYRHVAGLMKAALT